MELLLCLVLCSDAVTDIHRRHRHRHRIHRHVYQANFVESYYLLSWHLEAAVSFDSVSQFVVVAHFQELEAYKASTTLANPEKEAFQLYHLRAHEWAVELVEFEVNHHYLR